VAKASTNRPNSVMSQGASSRSPFGRSCTRDQFPAQLAAVSRTITPHASRMPYARIARRRGKAKAQVAVARSILIIISLGNLTGGTGSK
jgi:hypothetical protein